MSESIEVTLADLLPTTYSLRALGVHNWGPFHGHHCAEIDPGGTAIVGPTGCGKTSLIDAFMTLICSSPRYNLASTGGHESDRDLMSYVRGVSGAGTQNGDNAHITRPQKTVTSMEARFENGEQSVTLTAILWVDSSSNAIADLKRAWIFSENPKYNITELLGIQQSNGMRGLKQLNREVQGVHVYDNKKAYLAQLRRFFDVGENAFTLLNRAAGLKQINSIDDLFRDLVLDDHAFFNRAAEVVAEFEDLATIHTELETAKQQQKSLLPIAAEHNLLEQSLTALDQLQHLQGILPVWFAMHAHRLWTAKMQELQTLQTQNQARLLQFEDDIEQADNKRQTLHGQYMNAGGGSIEQVNAQIETHNDLLRRNQTRAKHYLQITNALQFDSTIAQESLALNKQHAESLAKTKGDELEETEEALFAAVADKRNDEDKVAELQIELQKIAKNRSNIPSKYIDFQKELADELDLNAEALPFIAQLIEVKPEHRAWRGAIERALGGQRLRLLVPAAMMKKAMSWVNHRNNRLNIRLLRVETHYSPAKFMDDGFTRKLNFKQHSYREAMKSLLAGLDRHCVDRADALDNTPWGMTIEGSMTGKSGHFDKQDHRRLEQDWFTGFDNKDRIESLQAALQDAESELMANKRRVEQGKQARSLIEQGLKLLEQLQSIHYEDIDVPGITAKIESLKQQLSAMLAPNSDTAALKLQWEAAKATLEAMRTQKEEALGKQAVLKKDHDDAQAQLKAAFLQSGDGLADGDMELGNEYFTLAALDQIRELEKQSDQSLQRDIAKRAKQIADCQIKLTKLMANAKKLDTGALAEAGADAEDAPEYIKQLHILNEEALPEKQQRFLTYLNQSSDQGVTQLLMSIKSEVEKIEHRIDDLNDTMRRVDYQPERYLRLNPQLVIHDSLNILNKAQQHLRYAATVDDEGSSHYKALQTVVDILRDASERKRTKGAQALLDPRYRLQFSVSVIERSSGEVFETRKGSQGGSGGEKEIIASYILTASLSYALCPDGSPLPLFGTIILDEAFSRSSQAVASRIIAALREFGLHPLFVTPNKEMKLLREHTRSAILIHNKNARSSTISLSWEDIEREAHNQKQKRHETSQ